MHKIDLLEEFFKICSELAKHEVPYALIGGIAVSIHTEPRMTKDIDFLTIPEAIGDFRSVLEECGYDESAQPWAFRSSLTALHRFVKVVDDDFLPVDILVNGEERYRSVVANAQAAQWAGGVVRVATVDDLIWLKRQRNSLQDQADIERLSQ